MLNRTHWTFTSTRILVALFVLGICLETRSHDLSTTPITWNREISRIVYAHCASCHHDGGTSFSLMTYREAQPRAVAMRDAVLSRRMPPWGAVKGFGDFRNDEGLTQEQIELVADWVQDDMPKGNNPNALPKLPTFEKVPPFTPPKNGVVVRGELKLNIPLTLDGLLPDRVPKGTSMRIVADLPDGSVEPLLWFYEYKESFRHPFLFRGPLDLPAGTIIHGVPPTATIVMVKAYAFRGKVERVDPSAKTLTVNGENVKGWMGSTRKTYTVHDDDLFKTIKVGDPITSKVYDGDFNTLYDVRTVSTKDNRSHSTKE